MATFADFESIYRKISIYQNFRYIETFDTEVDDMVRYDISISKWYINVFDISTHL